MSNDPSPSERVIPSEGVVERSASHAAMQTVETFGTVGVGTLGGLVAKDLYGKAKNALGMNSNNATPPSDSKD